MTTDIANESHSTDADAAFEKEKRTLAWAHRVFAAFVVTFYFNVRLGSIYGNTIQASDTEALTWLLPGFGLSLLCILAYGGFLGKCWVMRQERGALGEEPGLFTHGLISRSTLKQFIRIVPAGVVLVELVLLMAG